MKNAIVRTRWHCDVFLPPVMLEKLFSFQSWDCLAGPLILYRSAAKVVCCILTRAGSDGVSRPRSQPLPFGRRSLLSP